MRYFLGYLSSETLALLLLPILQTSGAALLGYFLGCLIIIIII